MANITTVNPWLIDTASATAVSNDRLKVQSFRWVGGSTAGHQCIVKDKAGNQVWESVAAGANHIDDSSAVAPNGFDVNGLAVTTLGSGKLSIYFK